MLRDYATENCDNYSWNNRGKRYYLVRSRSMPIQSGGEVWWLLIRVL